MSFCCSHLKNVHIQQQVVDPFGCRAKRLGPCSRHSWWRMAHPGDASPHRRSESQEKCRAKDSNPDPVERNSTIVIFFFFYIYIKKNNNIIYCIPKCFFFFFFYIYNDSFVISQPYVFFFIQSCYKLIHGDKKNVFCSTDLAAKMNKLFRLLPAPWGFLDGSRVPLGACRWLTARKEQIRACIYHQQGLLETIVIRSTLSIYTVSTGGPPV